MRSANGHRLVPQSRNLIGPGTPYLVPDAKEREGPQVTFPLFRGRSCSLFQAPSCQRGARAAAAPKGMAFRIPDPINSPLVAPGIQPPMSPRRSFRPDCRSLAIRPAPSAPWPVRAAYSVHRAWPESESPEIRQRDHKRPRLRSPGLPGRDLGTHLGRLLPGTSGRPIADGEVDLAGRASGYASNLHHAAQLNRCVRPSHAAIAWAGV